MSTIALGIIFKNVAENVWGRDDLKFPSPLPEAPLKFLGANVLPMEILVVVGALALMLGVELFNRRSIYGKAVVATFIDRVAAKNVAAPPEIAIPSLRAVLGYDARPTLKEVRVPAHAVNADLYPTDVDANRRHFASYDVTIMRGVGHYVMLEDPARFSDLLAGAITDLLAKAPAR